MSVLEGFDMLVATHFCTQPGRPKLSVMPFASMAAIGYG